MHEWGPAAPVKLLSIARERSALVSGIIILIGFYGEHLFARGSYGGNTHRTIDTKAHEPNIFFTSSKVAYSYTRNAYNLKKRCLKNVLKFNTFLNLKQTYISCNNNFSVASKMRRKYYVSVTSLHRYCHYRHEIVVTIAIYEYVPGIHN